MAKFFTKFKSWFLQHNDTQQILKGQFAPQDLTKNINTKWASHTALNRSNEILQFLNKEADTITFRVVMYDRDDFIRTSDRDMNLLQLWAKPDPYFGNTPPELTFWVGAGWEMMECVIDSLSNIRYEEPSILGNVKGVSADITLREYSKFSLDAKGLYETRYHRAAHRDYYELICYREYKSPILGDVIRKQHPTKPNLQIADVVRLPSVESVRRNTIETKSIVLSSAYSKKLTATKTRRIEMFDLRSLDYISHTVIQ